MTPEKLKEIREKQFQFVNNASIQYYLETGTVSGTFYTCLENIQLETEKAAKLEVISEIGLILESRDFCRCEPIGSGEEYCNNGCLLRQKLAELKQQIIG